MTAQDVAWGKAISPGLTILQDDCKLVIAAAGTKDISTFQMACNTTKEDIISAEVVNQAMPVSRDMQIAKDDYTTALASIWAGVDDVSAGYAASDLAKINLGTSEILRSNVYFTKISRDIDVAKAA